RHASLNTRRFTKTRHEERECVLPVEDDLGRDRHPAGVFVRRHGHRLLRRSGVACVAAEESDPGFVVRRSAVGWNLILKGDQVGCDHPQYEVGEECLVWLGRYDLVWLQLLRRQWYERR